MTTGVQNIHVSQEEYSQTMHDAVNSYYAHTMNDPTMSQDEARETTAAMAERALDAVDEFAANAAAANEAEPTQSMAKKLAQRPAPMKAVVSGERTAKVARAIVESNSKNVRCGYGRSLSEVPWRGAGILCTPPS